MEFVSAQDRAEKLVSVISKGAGEPWFIALRHQDDEPLQLGPYINPALANHDAAQIRKFIARLIEKDETNRD